jgi:hypothetical protein
VSLDLEEAQRNLGLSTDLHLHASWAVVYGPQLIAELSAARAVVEAAKSEKVEYCDGQYKHSLDCEPCHLALICRALSTPEVKP